jgi:sulfate-transporting ATPase
VITFLQFAVIGAATGAVYALLAQGVVLVHMASGIVNFSQGAVAVVAGFFFASLTQASGWGTWPSFAIVTVGAAFCGAAIYWIAMRPLRSASPLSRVIATLAVLLIASGLATLHWGTSVVLIQPYLSSSVSHFGSLVISRSQIILVVIACAITVLLWAVTKWALPGIAIRAVAENQRATAALGWSPDVLSTASWAVAGALGAAAGMLIAPVTGVQVSDMTLYIVITIAAALVGRFSSFPLALAGGVLIGIIQAEASNYSGVQGLPDALPFLVIVLFLVVRGQGVPTRANLTERFAELGTGRIRPRFLIPATLVLAVLMSTVFSNDLNSGLIVSLSFAIVLLSVVVLTGYAGQLSLAQMCFGGIGALTAGRLVQEASFGFLPALIAGVLATIPIGVLFALPALRTRGITLAMVTLGLGSAVSDVVFTNSSYIGGIEGTPVGQQTLFGLNIDAGLHPGRYAVLTLAFAVLSGLMVCAVRRGRVGRRLIAVRSNERAAAALGVNVYGTKLYAFALSAALAALGGILLGFQFETIQYSGYDPLASLVATGYTVIGGLGFVAGAFTASPLASGGIGSWIFDRFGPNFETYLPLIGGVGLLLTLLQNPDGIVSNCLKFSARMASRFHHRAGRPLAPTQSGATAKPGSANEGMPDRSAASASAQEPRGAVLEARDLVVRYGGVTAVNEVSITLSPGRISGLIGPNGAGKTSVIDAMTGFVRPAAGSIVLDGQDITRWPTYRRARSGISRSFQALELFDSVTTRENLLTASEERDGLAYLTNLVYIRPGVYGDAALAAIREFGLEPDLERKPSEMPYGRRRLLAIARAVALGPSVLLLDEPAAGLDENETAEMAELVRNLATRWGMAILLVEHDMSFVMNVCDDITVIDFGQPIAYGTPQQVQDDPAVIAAYLGEPESAQEALSSESPADLHTFSLDSRDETGTPR